VSGFVAVLNLDGAPVDRQILGRMTEALAFRGPDAQRVWIDGHVGLGHTLLATVDDFPEPARPCSIDGRIRIVADARVDGRSELMAKLAAKMGGVRADASDPELILHAYAAWGDACVDHLIGDFAFVIWDSPRRRLFAARDHFGVKPLYYARTRQSVLVSNTIDALSLHPLVSAELNESAVGDFLLFGQLVEPTTTVFADIQRVPAAHVFSCAAGSVRLTRYWSLAIEPPLRLRKQSDYVEQFTELLRTAVGDRMRTSHIALYMSGGLDSSSVASVARELSPKASLRAHTAVYDELIPDDERHFSGRVAGHLGIPIEYLAADSRVLSQDWANHSTPEPVAAPLHAVFNDLCTKISADSRVALTGYGGDPGLLAWPGSMSNMLSWDGMRGLAATLIASLVRYRRLPRIGLRTALRRRLNRPADMASPPSWLSPDFASRLDIEERWKRQMSPTVPKHPFRQSAYDSLVNPFWAFRFESHDAGFTGRTIEFRHPFFDLRLMRFMLSLPSLPWCVDKHILRESTRGRLPEDVRIRPKTPLRTDPVPILLRNHPEVAENFRPTPGLDRFVVGEEARQLLATSDDSASAWANLRPYSLSNWLCQRMPAMTSVVEGAAPYSEVCGTVQS
jgi:asparagine synthase (glutamine-hydrolysing)